MISSTKRGSVTACICLLLLKIIVDERSPVFNDHPWTPLVVLPLFLLFLLRFLLLLRFALSSSTTCHQCTWCHQNRVLKFIVFKHM